MYFHNRILSDLAIYEQIMAAVSYLHRIIFIERRLYYIARNNENEMRRLSVNWSFEATVLLCICCVL